MRSLPPRPALPAVPAVLAGLVLGLLAALAAPSPTASAHGARADGEGVPPVLIATYNTEQAVSPDDFMSDIRALVSHRPDVVTLQEMANPAKRKRMRHQILDCSSCAYDGYLPTPATPGSTPILWRTDRFALVKATTVQVTEATYVGPKGAGPSTIRPKFVNWVELRDLRTGRPVNVLNNHAVPSVQGKSGGPNYHNKKRLEIYRQHMEGLDALVRRVRQENRGMVFVTGDLNVNFRRDKQLQPKIFPYYNLGLVRLRASYDLLGEPKAGTHRLGNGNSTRLIDYVYMDQRRFASAVSQQVLTEGYHSDHRPLLVGVQIQPYAGRARS